MRCFNDERRRKRKNEKRQRVGYLNFNFIIEIF